MTIILSCDHQIFTCSCSLSIPPSVLMIISSYPHHILMMHHIFISYDILIKSSPAHARCPPPLGSLDLLPSLSYSKPEDENHLNNQYHHCFLSVIIVLNIMALFFQSLLITTACQNIKTNCWSSKCLPYQKQNQVDLAGWLFRLAQPLWCT